MNKLNKNIAKTIYYGLILMLGLSLNNAVSWAQEMDKQISAPQIYTIYNISIDETAATSSRASRAAVRSAQRRALEKLFRKIIRQEDQAALARLTDGQVTELVSGLEVANEKSSAVRYMADFTIHFSRAKIYNFLSEKQIPFAETLSTPASILTVLEKDGASVLWETNNDWRKAWQEYDTANNLVPIRVMVPSLAHRMTITSWQAQKGDKQSLQEFADKYKARKLYIMSAHVEYDLGEGRNTLELTIFKLGEDQHIFRTTISLGHDTADLRGLYDEAIKQATYWLDNQWKEKVMIHFGTSSSLKVNIQYDSSADWFEIKKKLEAISLIRKVTYKKFAVMAAHVEIEHSGDVEQIMLTLEQEDLILTEKTDNMEFEIYPWILRLKK